MHHSTERVLKFARRFGTRLRRRLSEEPIPDTKPNGDGTRANGLEPQGPTIDLCGQQASDRIRDLLLDSKPCMIARIGHTELKAMLRLRMSQTYGPLGNAWRFITEKQEVFWWDEAIRWELRYSSGFFPTSQESMERFARLYLDELACADVLGAWLKEEDQIADRFPNARRIPLQDLEPFFHVDPWTVALEGKNVLVVHPFEKSIRAQYEKRRHLFSDSRMLPDFNLKTLKAVQSLGGHTEGFATWFDALQSMCDAVSKIDFEVAIVGAGAYGLPLAAHIKRMGRKVVHMGGASQLMFGIRGKRWEQREIYRALLNDYWARPLPEETPTGHHHVDHGKSYW